MKRVIFLVGALLIVASHAMADEEREWVVRLDCRGWESGACYAASNGSYGSLRSSRRFDSFEEASLFLKTLTNSLKEKHPRIVPAEVKDVEAASDRAWVVRLDCRGWENQACYASTNGSYGTLHRARRFDSYEEASLFQDTLTNKMRENNPRIVEVGADGNE